MTLDFLVALDTLAGLCLPGSLAFQLFNLLLVIRRSV